MPTAPVVVSAVLITPSTVTAPGPTYGASSGEDAFAFGRWLASSHAAARPAGQPVTNESIVATLNAIRPEHGHWVGQPRIMATRGSPGQVKIERVVVFDLADPQGVVLSSDAMARLQQQLRDALPGWQIKVPTLATATDLQQTSDRTIPVLIHTEASTVLQTQAPRAADIKAGFERFSHSPLAENGHWVGPAPRIVRQASIGSNNTFAAWLYEWPDTPWVRANLRTLVEALQWAVDRGLRDETQRRDTLNNVRLTPWDAVTATTWNANINGPIEWWRSGQAAVTRTTTEFPGIGSTEYVENPVGPDTAATHPGATDTAGRLISGAKTLGALFLAGIAAWYLVPVIAHRLDRPVLVRANPIGFVSAALLQPGAAVEWWPASAAAAASYEGVLKIGARGKVMHDAKGRVRKVDGVDSMAVRFESGAVAMVPIRDLGIPDELRWDRHRVAA